MHKRFGEGITSLAGALELTETTSLALFDELQSSHDPQPSLSQVHPPLSMSNTVKETLVN
eukprot:snap_masked-scaffold_106-processed-gene-0.13-mRNA-1 protein AED:1.00 eAED:1.00 QI:0/-1/0/0/-1/1/1/0/59